MKLPLKQFKTISNRRLKINTNRILAVAPAQELEDDGIREIQKLNPDADLNQYVALYIDGMRVPIVVEIIEGDNDFSFD